MDRPFKITSAMLDVMEALLTEGDDVHGYAIAHTAGKPTGSVYPILARLQSAGMLDSHWEAEQPVAGRPRKKLYRLTPTGRAGVRDILLERRGQLPQTTPRPASGREINWGAT
ncbi:PadR family transcriptional regulator [Streptomyces europaeiscabiei]|uniref:PadR family transcriptional regulator n=1 Tax=Streptomyces europaeiscabiei TaxID=146819 RepID=UPI0029BB3844|nr:PadR family transcriptional regulator [Streptomyces europaeiscabiei]MDX3588938.1 PadR family transcriptional regulator [Streptomyces europaeiscabiei]